ncbi:hypothetical protein [Paenibacillus sp. UNC499MF]|uniref:hypothetical protein n=1 Tax=Paenibacillus sp. UNC499MF TaxID=1502751 RepID=UPI00089FA856|nr:hypothetical protein [Paenibacillus sp. UNC499MF]SEG75862.1 hypothetical protein SAMN02799616_04865 [Paenibacillus sp. UNC499MF]
MNKYVTYIVVSIIVILIPVIGLLYGLWDMNQPKIGPIGNGVKVGPTFPQLIVMVMTFLTGILNLIVAIKTYRDHKAKDN